MQYISQLKNTFGSIQLLNEGAYSAVLALSSEQVLKIQSKYSGLSLKAEYIVMSQLQGQFFPFVHEYWQTSQYQVIRMERLGRNLLQVDIEPQHYFTITSQIFKALHRLHASSYLHRDIKPQNLCFALDDHLSCKLVDFGLAVSFEKAVFLKDEQSFVGSVTYASPFLKPGRTYSQIDDYYSAFYTIVSVMKGQLPWATNFIKQLKFQERLEEVTMLKEKFGLLGLCSDLPRFLSEAAEHLRRFGEGERVALLELQEEQGVEETLSSAQQLQRRGSRKLSKRLSIDLSF